MTGRANFTSRWRCGLGAVIFAFALGVFGIAQLRAEPPARPIGSFATAKKIARDTIYVDKPITLYCACDYQPSSSRSGGRIDTFQCGYLPRKNEKRGRRLEWEHIMPASFFGQERRCWAEGHSDCVTSKGKAFKGRKCCARVDETFEHMEADLHNLVPSVGELNGDRSNRPYDMVEMEQRLYGRCDFEVDFPGKRVEPEKDVRGDVARVWLYMSDAYGLDLTAKMQTQFQDWSQADPVDDWERTRDERIEAEQGNRNRFVRP